MILIDLTQVSRGEQRATDDAFKNYNALLKADIATQQTNEYFDGAPGRQAVIRLNSQRDQQLAAGLSANLDRIVRADINQTLGNAASRNVAGLMEQSTAALTLPEIPALSQNQVRTDVANSQNTLYRAETLDPLRQEITFNDRSQTILQQPNRFALSDQRLQADLNQQPQRTRIENNDLDTEEQLQEGARKLALDEQAYNQRVMEGKGRDLGIEQSLYQRKLKLQGMQTDTQIKEQPLRANISQEELQLTRDLQTGVRELAIAEQAYNKRVQAGEARDLGLEQELATKRLELAKKKQVLANAEVDAATTLQKVTSATTLTRAQGQSEREPWRQQQLGAQQVAATSSAEFAVQLQPGSQDIERMQQLIKTGQVKWDQLNQPAQLAIEQDNLTIQRSNTALALRRLPTTQKIKILQQGFTLDDAEQTKELQGYAESARQIRAKDQPDAEMAKLQQDKFNRAVAVGTRAIQQLIVTTPPAQSTAAQRAALGDTLKQHQLMLPGDVVMADAGGYFIQPKDGERRPLTDLFTALRATAAKQTSGKPSQFSTTVTPTADGPVATRNLETFGRPPTAAERAYLEAPAAGTPPPASNGAATAAALIGGAPTVVPPAYTLPQAPVVAPEPLPLTNNVQIGPQP